MKDGEQFFSYLMLEKWGHPSLNFVVFWKNVRKINTRKLFYPVIFMSKLSVQISDGEKNVRKINRSGHFHVQIIYKYPMVKKFTKINTWTLFYPVIFMCKLSTNLRWWKNVRKINTRKLYYHVQIISDGVLKQLCGFLKKYLESAKNVSDVQPPLILTCLAMICNVECYL